MNTPNNPPRSLAEFRGIGYDKGRPALIQALWFAVMNLVFMKWWLPKRARPTILRIFGASVGAGVHVRHRVRVLWPWKLDIGDNAWIGEDAWILNLEQVSIGSNACVSQDARLITGSHLQRSSTFEYDNGPIIIGDGAWIAMGATVLRGVTVHDGATVGAGVVVASDVPPYTVLRPKPNELYNLRPQKEDSAWLKD